MDFDTGSILIEARDQIAVSQLFMLFTDDKMLQGERFSSRCGKSSRKLLIRFETFMEAERLSDLSIFINFKSTR